MTTGAMYEVEVTPELLPEVDTGAARMVAIRLRVAAEAGREAVGRLDAGATPSWWGGAGNAYLSARAETSRQLVDLASLTGVFAAAVDRFADGIDACLPRLRRAAAALIESRERARAASVLMQDDASRLGSLAHDAQAAFDAEVAVYQGFIRELILATDEVKLAPKPRSETVGDHVLAGVERLWKLSVAEPADVLWKLTIGGLEDPDGWRALVSAIPGGLWDQATHPVRTADEMLGGPEYRDGEWGAAVGTTLSMAVASKYARRVATDDVLVRFARNMADPDAPRPRTQTIDEMYELVDLRRSEHYELGHAIRRHIDVDDEYLESRLVDGTLLDDGHFDGQPPKNASAFDDLDTAELAATMAVNERRAKIGRWLAGDNATQTIQVTLDEQVGRVMTMGPNGPETIRSNVVKVVLARDGDTIYIKTAYPVPSR